MSDVDGTFVVNSLTITVGLIVALWMLALALFGLVLVLDAVDHLRDALARRRARAKATDVA